MPQQKLPDRLAFFATVVGFAMLAVALFSNALGLTHDPLSKARILLAVLGAFTLAVGLLKQRFVRLYVAAAVLVANTLLLLAGLEFGAVVANRLLWTDDMPEYDAVQEEGSLTGVTEAFYVGWRGRPYAGEAVTIGEDGLRLTPPPSPDGRTTPVRVFAFGGSAMWGEGATDAETIPAYLQTLSSDTDQPVRVTNFAQRAWVSTQNLIELTLELRRGNVPDVVVFYDGYNEIFSAYATGRTGVPENFGGISRDSSVAAAIGNTELLKLLTRWRSPVAPAIAVEDMARSVVETYSQVIRTVRALGDGYGFESRFYWQPQLFGDPKPLTPEEKRLLDHPWLAQPVKELTLAVRPHIERLARQHNDVVDLRDVFAGVPERLYHDPCHVRGEGNRVIAGAILERGFHAAR